ncbi:hypothetical protein NUW54_g10972 [Trametes sanguinea]|uniref:Uncharacterized protein n=1 Tax=Trametes sanguinea TaxID=158606 RepID=A0ACC1NMX4_9APHY|nr:hypothetical protein NUW54_g10972 [Trametes sanguinea]
MALKGLPSPASGDSNSPSPDLHSDGPSTNASPLSASQSLYISQASDEGESNGHHSARGTPTRLMSDPTRANNAGKGGCWYAYLVHRVHRARRVLTLVLCPLPSTSATAVGHAASAVRYVHHGAARLLVIATGADTHLTPLPSPI